MTLALGRSSTRVMPSVTSARYSPGPGMVISSRECSVRLDTSLNSHCQHQKTLYRCYSLTFSHKADEKADWKMIKTRTFRIKESVHDLLPQFRRNRLRCRDYLPG